MLYRILTIIIFFISVSVKGQKLHYELPDNASKMYSQGNYKKALELYTELRKKDLKNIKYKFRLGVCYLYNYKYTKSIELLESVSKSVNSPQEVWYYLGKVYHLSNRYNIAIKAYKKYISIGPTDENLIKKASRNIEMCYNAKEIAKNPLHISFENLGKRVNSKGKEYIPVITPDESIIMFTTRREGTTGRIYDLKGYYTADIYSSKYKYGKWSRTRSIGFPNSYGNEQIAGISENGIHALYYVDNPSSKNNLQISTKTKSSFKRAVKIKASSINNKASKQNSATISNDGNLIIFSSDRDNGLGNLDLYTSKKLPNGEWGEAKNISQVINTDQDECYPYLTNNGKTLFFASTGHNSIGGFDIFKSTFNTSTKRWSKPTNIGYPINTPDDNFNICFSQNKKYAYTSAYRKDSYGDLDLYRITFEDNDPSYTTIKGTIIDVDSNIINEPYIIEVFDKTTDELYGIYEVNPNKGSYIMILPPNKYQLLIDVPKKGIFSKLFNVMGRNQYQKEITKNIQVTFEDKEE